MSRRGGLRSFEIFSVFGVCEAAAARTLIDEGIATRIPPEQIPAQVAVNDSGAPALFAVIVPRNHIPRFERLCADLRA